MKILVVVHVFYPDIWPELAECIRNVEGGELIVTYVDEAAVAGARRDFPSARFLRCENRGYDVWPFVRALTAVGLAQYDLVVKLHTKRDVEFPHRIVIGNTWLNDFRWREHLLAFVKTPAAWRRTLARFDDPRVGMVADRHVIFSRGDAILPSHRASYDAAAELLRSRLGLRAPRRGRFVGGTMFAVRAAALRPLVELGVGVEDFAVSAGHDTETFAHLLERLLGLAVGAQRLRVVAFNGSVALRRLEYALGRFVYSHRRSSRRESIRIFGITVYRRKLAKNAGPDARQ